MPVKDTVTCGMFLGLLLVAVLWFMFEMRRLVLNLNSNPLNPKSVSYPLTLNFCSIFKVALSFYVVVAQVGQVHA